MELFRRDLSPLQYQVTYCSTNNSLANLASSLARCPDSAEVRVPDDVAVTLFALLLGDDRHVQLVQHWTDGSVWNASKHLGCP